MYHKSDDIITMKKHLEMKDKVLCAKYVEKLLVANCPIGPNGQETTINKVDITPSVISRFFLLQIASKKTIKH
jgi:hypothetical protein